MRRMSHADAGANGTTRAVFSSGCNLVPESVGTPGTLLRGCSGEAFDAHGCGFSAPDAKSGDAALEVEALERGEERDENAGAGCANWVAECAGASVDVELVARNGEVPHGGHSDYGEGLVDFEEIHLIEKPAGAIDECSNSTDGSGRKERRLVRECSVASN